jgi:hypothetical protein
MATEENGSDHNSLQTAGGRGKAEQAQSLYHCYGAGEEEAATRPCGVVSEYRVNIPDAAALNCFGALQINVCITQHPMALKSMDFDFHPLSAF